MANLWELHRDGDCDSWTCPICEVEDLVACEPDCNPALRLFCSPECEAAWEG